MCALIWLIVGVVILTITIWVRRHTYGVTYKHGKYVADLDNPTSFPMWLLLVLVVASFIPIVNIILFIVTMMEWLIGYS
jgi:hypothetical protein